MYYGNTAKRRRGGWDGGCEDEVTELQSYEEERTDEQENILEREKVGFIEKTAWRQIRNGGREVTVTSRLQRQK